MEPVNPDRLSTASGGTSFSASISSSPSVGLSGATGIARGLLPLPAEVEAARLPFPASLGLGAPLTSIANAPAAIAVPKPRAAPKERPRRLRREYIIQRALEVLPGATALLIVSTFVWGALFLPFPLAVMLIAFDLYWAWRSINAGIHVVRGRSILKREAKVDWRQRYNEAAAAGKAFLRWDDVRHVVIIPSYKESVEKLSTTLDTLADQTLGADKLVVVLALEGAEAEAPAKAAALQEKYGDSFMLFFPTFHPPNIPGEIKGKSSNENFAARIAKRRLVDEMGYDLDLLTITSCDADTQFPPAYYACLTYKFATNPKRYRRFWQAPIFYYNNVWTVPAPLRLPNSLGGLNHLAKLSRKYCVLFPQSTYSLSLRMAHEADYWDPDIISEDWHMFLKCFFHLGGTVDVEPIFLPVGNDGVRVNGYFRTFWEHYQQARRHAWGASDIPYAIKMAFAHSEIRFRTRLRRTWSVFENHVLWSSQWFLITVPAMLMLFLGFHVGPHYIDMFGLHLGPWWFNNASGSILKPCMAPLGSMILIDAFLRPPQPKGLPFWYLPVQYGQWFLLAPITFFFTALPALESQMRLLIGKRLEYKVTEKA
jgi:hypothetical protein